MKKLLFIPLFLLCTVSLAFSQTQNSSDNTEPELVLTEKTDMNLKNIAQSIGFRGSLVMSIEELMGSASQAAVIKQIGDNNFAAVTQSGANQFAFILQDGSFLEANLTMDGTNNNAIIKQRGTQLSTDIDLVGDNNEFKLLQKGVGLQNNIILNDVNGSDLFFLQSENGFLYQQGGGNGVALQIEQTGPMPAIIITNN